MKERKEKNRSKRGGKDVGIKITRSEEKEVEVDKW